MIEKIKELKKTQEICSIYSDGNETTKFSVGFIVDHDENFFLLERIDTNGKNDGFGGELLRTIIKIETASKYNRKIEKLYTFNKQKRHKIIDCKNDVVVALLTFAKQSNKICSIVLCESDNNDIIGFVKNIEKDLVEMQAIDEDGNEDGNAFVELGKISSIVCGSEDENRNEIFYKMNNKPGN